jgi:hypothetical protein
MTLFVLDPFTPDIEARTSNQYHQKSAKCHTKF